MLNLEIKNLFLKETDSTQKEARRKIAEMPQDKITCLIADGQTEGYGRWQRKWQSPKGFDNIYCTFYFALEEQPKNLSNLPLLLAYSLAELLSKQEIYAQIKWPNDLLLSGKKFAGTICETIFEKERAHIFLGLGVNLNMPQKELDKIDIPATSLMQESKQNWDRELFLKELETAFLKNLKLFFQQGFASFALKIEKLLAFKNETVVFYDGQEKYEGQIIGIRDDGALNFKLKESGEIKTFFSGDILTFKKPTVS